MTPVPHHYDVHGLRVRSHVPLDLDFSAGTESPATSLDVLVLKKAQKRGPGYQRVASGLYYSKNSRSILSSMRIFGIDVSWELSSILEPATQLRVSPSFAWISKWLLHQPVSSVHRLNVLVRFILQVKLLLQGRTFLVGGGVTWNQKNILFTGTGGSGKTQSTLQFLRDYPGEFLSEDLLILDKARIYPFPMPMRIRRLNVDFMSFSTFERPTQKFEKRMAAPNDLPCDIFFLELGEERQIQTISLDTAIRKLAALNNRALMYFHERVLSFVPYVEEKFSFLDMQIKQNEILHARLKQSHSYILSARRTDDYNPMLRELYQNHEKK